MTSALADVRDHLSDILIELSSTPEGASSRDVVKEFRSRYAHLVKRASVALEDMALVQVASGLKRRKPPRSMEATLDLFSELDQVVVIVGVKDGKKIRKNKAPRKLTLEEAESCLADHRADRERNDKLIEKLEALVEIARPYILGGGTLEEGVAAARVIKREGDG